MTDVEEISRIVAGLDQVSSDPEVERLTAGIAPARAEDAEIERLIYGTPPTTETNDTVVLSQTSPHWGPNTLTGPSGLRVGDADYWVPDGAQIKSSARSLTAWVRHEGKTYVYSALGLLHQSDDERAAASTSWELL